MLETIGFYVKTSMITSRMMIISTVKAFFRIISFIFRFIRLEMILDEILSIAFL